MNFLRPLSETARRLVAMGAGLILLAGAVWLAGTAIGDAPPGDAGSLWGWFAGCAVGAIVVTAPLVWRKMRAPDRKSYQGPLRPILLAGAGGGALLGRQLLDGPQALVMFTGACFGFVAGTTLVLLYDFFTNNLTYGRSWHFPQDSQGRDGAPDQSSNTSSPT